MTKEYICIVCPNSCHLTVTDENGEIKVTGNRCKRGTDHGISEYTRPMRMLTSTVRTENGSLPRLSVVSTDEIPKEKLKDCLNDVYGACVKAPVTCGDIIIKNIQNTGVDIIASRSMKEKE